jgi:hypothetical protein
MNARNQYSLTGSAPEMYERNMVPAIFAPFAKGLLAFANILAGEHVLDVACGTGIVARLAWPQVAPSGRVVGVDVNAALTEMHRMLRASGRLVLSVWRPIQYNPSHAVFANVLERHVSAAAGATRRAPFTLSNRDEIRALVAGAGFHEIVVRLDARVARFPAAEAMIRIMMAGTPLATAMAEADPAVLQTVIAKVTEGVAAYEDDQGLALPMQAWVVTAKA